MENGILIKVGKEAVYLEMEDKLGKIVWDKIFDDYAEMKIDGKIYRFNLYNDFADEMLALGVCQIIGDD